MTSIQIQCVDNGWIVVYVNSGQQTAAVFTNRAEMQSHIDELLDTASSED